MTEATWKVYDSIEGYYKKYNGKIWIGSMWQFLVNTIINIRDVEYEGNFLNRRETIGYSTKTVFRGVRKSNAVSHNPHSVDLKWIHFNIILFN